MTKRKEKKPKRKVAWCEEDEAHHQALINCADEYAKALQELLSIPGTSVIEDVQYGLCLLNQQRRAETWPDRFEPKYNLSVEESPLKESLSAARKLLEFSDLTTILHHELNYNHYWAINETSKILSKAIGEEYDDTLVRIVDY
ncbi:hypothetical protein Glove_26g241 [Diversispora epigaea]|uniref:Uncharacterized protein n=1 Tax=Diversispora epigaea TaxID=1348612 RepID=A0A397JJC9_9GLOM|nr:hypothetical protein Glove_26g241 [Diversispora epigaea]